MPDPRRNQRVWAHGPAGAARRVRQLRTFTIVHINELKGGPETAAHLLEFDSVHGRWRVPIAAERTGSELRTITSATATSMLPAEVPWDEAGVEMVLECSGKFLTPEALEPYFDRGVRKVVVAAPVKQGALNIVMGVNDHLYDPERHHIVTAASCTTNCLAPDGESYPPKARHSARRYHHDPRRHQYSDGGRLRRTRICGGPAPR